MRERERREGEGERERHFFYYEFNVRIEKQTLSHVETLHVLLYVFECFSDEIEKEKKGERGERENTNAQKVP